MVVSLTLSRLKVKYNKTARPDTAAPSNAPRTVAEIIDKTYTKVIKLLIH